MPSVSQAQNRFWHAKEEDPDAPAKLKKVARDFLAADRGRNIGKLPQHAPKEAPEFGALDA